jgi:hypothetical protein
VNPAAVESLSLRPEPSRAFRWLVLMFLSTAMFGNYYVYDCIAPATRTGPARSRSGEHHNGKKCIGVTENLPIFEDCDSKFGIGFIAEITAELQTRAAKGFFDWSLGVLRIPRLVDVLPESEGNSYFGIGNDARKPYNVKIVSRI